MDQPCAHCPFGLLKHFGTNEVVGKRSMVGVGAGDAAESIPNADEFIGRGMGHVHDPDHRGRVEWFGGRGEG